MIKLSKMTDYAVIILAEMVAGQKENERALMSASGLASSTKLPEPTVSKVLKLLAKEKIVTSVRGTNGGYSLNKSPEQINMAHVITATDGPVQLMACVDTNHECCDRADHCTMKGQWNPLNQAMVSALQGVSLAQMMGGRK